MPWGLVQPSTSLCMLHTLIGLQEPKPFKPNVWLQTYQTNKMLLLLPLTINQEGNLPT